jgi:small-conductance mechanosensitive channel
MRTAPDPRTSSLQPRHRTERPARIVRAARFPAAAAMLDPDTASSIAPAYSIPDVVAIIGFPYMALVGIRSLRRRSNAGMGASLLLAALFGFLAWMDIEVELPITVAGDGETARRIVNVPLLRTVAEICAASAVAGMIVRVIDLWRHSRDEEPLLRLQRSVIWLMLMVIGIGLMYEIHFVSNLPIRTAILSIGGASVFVVGLALQSTLGNVFAGYSMQASRVFRKGDTVQLGRGGVIGRIHESTLSTTSILMRDGGLLVLPHGAVLGKDFMNLDHPMPQLRQKVNVGIAYDVPPAVVKDAAIQVLASEPNVLRSPEPAVWLSEFGDSSIIYTLVFWVPNYEVQDTTLDRVRTRLWYALHDAGIEIPFPIRTIRMVEREEELRRTAAGATRVEQTAAALRACSLFDDRNISAAERRELARAASEVSLQPGEAAVRRGELSDAMFVIASGVLGVFSLASSPFFTRVLKEKA